MDVVVVLSALLVVVGIVGILVPVLPGLLLTWIGIAVWSVATRGALGWAVLAAATVIVLAGSAIKYLLPGKRLRDSGVPWSTIAAGGVLGVAGFFVVPVVGLLLGFVLGIYLAELIRVGSRDLAWPSTKRALVLIGWSIVIELAAGLLAATVWFAGVLVHLT
jgi:uncharacterized protein YqgC (DUF456 family)